MYKLGLAADRRLDEDPATERALADRRDAAAREATTGTRLGLLLSRRQLLFTTQPLTHIAQIRAPILDRLLKLAAPPTALHLVAQLMDHVEVQTGDTLVRHLGLDLESADEQAAPLGLLVEQRLGGKRLNAGRKDEERARVQQVWRGRQRRRRKAVEGSERAWLQDERDFEQ